MAHFHFWLGNHTAIGQGSLHDVIGIIGHQMRALGHTATWEDNNARFIVPPNDGINVVVEGFTPLVTQQIANAHAQGGRFICIATEEPSDYGFNHGFDPEMRMRQVCFPDAAKFFEGILYLVPGEHVGRWYSQWAPAAYAELGFAPSFIRTQKIEPIWDFGFFGSLTKRRYSIIKQLARRCSRGLQNNPHAVRIINTFPDQYTRDNWIMEAKVVVQLRKTDEMGLVSSSRCNTSLSCGRPIVAEPHDRLLSKPWDDIVKFTDTMEEFFNMCLATRAVWRAVHADQFEKFERILTPWKCIGEPLARIGIESPGAARAAA
jgi:hypothetical protein